MFLGLKNNNKGVSFSSTKETLTQAFSQYGQVLEVDLIMDEVRCRPRGFGYVTFSSNDEAAKALLELKRTVGRREGRDPRHNKSRNRINQTASRSMQWKELRAAKKWLFQKVRQEGLQHFIVLRSRRKKTRKLLNLSRVFDHVQVTPGTE